MTKYIYLCLILTGVPHLIPYPFNWDACIVSPLLQCAIVGTLAVKLTPYSKLRLKSLLLVFCAFSWLDVVLYPIRYLTAPYIVYSLEICVSFVFMLYIQNKWYNMPDDELENGYFFVTWSKPKNIYQQVVSLFLSKPFGGAGVIAGDSWYHYRLKTGKLEKTDLSVFLGRKSKYIVTRGSKINYRDICELNRMVGSEWSIRNNCITRLKSIAD